MEFLNQIIINFFYVLEYTAVVSVFAKLFEKRNYFKLRVIIYLIVALVLIILVAALNTFAVDILAGIWINAVTVSIFTLYSLVFLVLCYKGKTGHYLFHYCSAVILVIALSSARQIIITIGGQFNENFSDSIIDRLITILLLALIYISSRYFVKGFDNGVQVDIEAGYVLLYILNSVVIFVFNVTASNLTGLALKILTYIGIIFYSYMFLYVQYSLFLRRKEYMLRTKQEAEYSIMEQVSHETMNLYNELKTNMDIINIKCHDLKHKINAFNRDRVFDEDELAEINTNIEMYNCTIQTGNEHLDVVLSSKSLLANKERITFIAVADGAKLNFLSVSDIYALFGNIIDNAMEYVISFEEDKRVIRLSVRGVGGFVSITEENTFEGELLFKDGLPKSTKNDKANHGFGMKSMRHVAEKYGGHIEVSAGDGLFKLSILIPIPNENNQM